MSNCRHGSAPDRNPDSCIIHNWENFIATAVAFVDRVHDQIRDKDIPLVVLGESLGGLVAAHAGLERPNKVKGTVLLCPALGVRYTLLLKLQSAVGGLLNTLVPRMKLVDAVRSASLCNSHLGSNPPGLERTAAIASLRSLCRSLDWS